MNLTADDIIKRDYFDNLDDTKDEMLRKFEATKPEVFTKNYTMRLRLRRDLQADYPADGEEYGDYDKFEKNKVETLNERGEDDSGIDNFQKNYNEMLRQMRTKEGEKLRAKDGKNLAATLTDVRTHTDDLAKKFNRARFEVDFHKLNADYEKEKKMVQDWSVLGLEYFGRVSPWTKELIYRNYQKGAKIKDLSLRFGLLPQRIKAIIW